MKPLFSVRFFIANTLFSLAFLSVTNVSIGQCQHDSPCDALPITIGSANAVQLSNVGCGVVLNEPNPPQGNCQAPGYWCDGGISKSVWAKFQVPDDGAYEVTTCHNGTSFDTQIACYISSGCYYTLNGFDSFGDGWNGGVVTITLDGVATNYSVPDGSFFSWLIPVTNGQTLTLSWQPGGWPEECSFELIDILGNTVLTVPATPPTGVLFNTTTICVGEICNLSTFQLVSANDDSFDGCVMPACNAVLPECVIPASAAYNNVIENDPFCCQVAWDGDCQAAYDAQNGSCTGASATNCFYTLNAFDSFGDGWEGGYVTFTVNGVPTDYALQGGSSGTFLVPVIAGAAISMSWTPGNHQVEASFQLLDSSGQEIVFVNSPVPVGNVFNGVAYCVPQSGMNPNSSKAYVSCLEPGTSVWVQIDGYNGQSGSVVISVKPYVGPNSVDAIVTDVNCPGGFGVPGEGSIVPVIYGWGTNYESLWTGPQGFTSEDSYIEGLTPGNYTLNATDACGNHVSQTFNISGPQPFFFQNTIAHTCPGASMGSISVVPSGGSAPYLMDWTGPNGFESDGGTISNLPAGTYHMFVTDSHGCNVMQVLYVNEIPLPAVNLGPDLTICASDIVLLSGPNASTYAWSTGASSSSVSISGSALGVGTHTISLTATNALGCAASDSMVLTVQSCVGVAENVLEDFAIYPNPATDRLTMTGLPGTSVQLRLLSADGKCVWVETTSGQSVVLLDVSAFASGLYLMEMQTDTGMRTEKVMIRH